jgi:hypothetical protein
MDALNSLVKGRKNPNGCPVSTTYFTSLDYTNYSMVTNYYVAGNEVADHTITHVGSPSIAEVRKDEHASGKKTAHVDLTGLH